MANFGFCFYDANFLKNYIVLPPFRPDGHLTPNGGKDYTLIPVGRGRLRFATLRFAPCPPAGGKYKRGHSTQLEISIFYQSLDKKIIA